MNVGFLHLGPDQHGVRRFGKILAVAVGKHVQVSEHDYQFTHPDIIPSLSRNLDILHCQYNAQFFSSIWGNLYTQMGYLKSFFKRVDVPVVMTVHDIYQPGYFQQARIFSTRDYIKAMIAPFRQSLRIIERESSSIVLNSDEEQRRLGHYVSLKKTRVIPHFVEEISNLCDTVEAKQNLGLEGKSLILVLGFIHPRKGQDRVIEAMKYLPEETVLWLAGDAVPAFQSYRDQLASKIETLGLQDRIRITGYLSEEELRHVLSATDVAICPFRNVSASGSLATLIAFNIPIVCSDLPLFREYNDMESNALQIISNWESESLAQTITNTLNNRNQFQTHLSNLKLQLHPDRIAKDYIKLYRELIT